MVRELQVFLCWCKLWLKQLTSFLQTPVGKLLDLSLNPLEVERGGKHEHSKKQKECGTSYYNTRLLRLYGNPVIIHFSLTEIDKICDTQTCRLSDTIVINNTIQHSEDFTVG